MRPLIIVLILFVLATFSSCQSPSKLQNNAETVEYRDLELRDSLRQRDRVRKAERNVERNEARAERRKRRRRY